MRRGRDEPVLDEEELGRTAQLLYEAFASIEAVGGSLSPYVPTHGSAAEQLPQLLEALAHARAAAREHGGPPVYYEPGCGAARFAERMRGRGVYILCLELDEYLAAEARDRLRREPLADVVVGDLTVFRPRRVDVAYAYLLPRAVSRVLEALEGTGAPLLSLDYPAEGPVDRLLEAARLLVAGRSVYAYEAPPPPPRRR